eukprot:404361-Prorocentrum_minimum.AAC.1
MEVGWTPLTSGLSCAGACQGALCRASGDAKGEGADPGAEKHGAHPDHREAVPGVQNGHRKERRLQQDDVPQLRVLLLLQVASPYEHPLYCQPPPLPSPLRAVTRRRAATAGRFSATDTGD